jgi:hypothetical protein
VCAINTAAHPKAHLRVADRDQPGLTDGDPRV